VKTTVVLLGRTSKVNKNGILNVSHEVFSELPAMLTLEKDQRMVAIIFLIQ
jgi:hypothetical protein